MVEYLEQLIQEKQYARAVDYAESILKGEQLTPEETAAAYCALVTSRLVLNQFEGVVAVGPAAVSLCEHLKAWDLFGHVCLDLGTAYYCLHRLDEALGAWFTYLSHLSEYGTSARYEGRAWFNISKAQSDEGEAAKAMQSLLRAIEAANRHGNQREAHGFRHALVEASLKAGRLEQVPALLARSLHYLRNHPTYRDSRLWHFKLRTDYAIATNRPHRALLTAVRGLSEAKGEPLLEHCFHAQLGHLMKVFGRYELALGHYLTARSCAVACRRPDLEASTDEIILPLVQGDHDLLARMESSLCAPELDGSENLG